MDLKLWTSFGYLMVSLSSCLTQYAVKSRLQHLSTLQNWLSNDGAPRAVLVNSTGTDSFVLSWSPPPDGGGKLMAYALSYRPVAPHGGFEEGGTEVSLPPVTRAKKISRLRAGTRYEVHLAAVYEGLRRVAAPPFSVATADLPADQPAQPCDCSDTGAVALCPPEPGANCSCLPGYSGPRCGQCLPGYYRASDRCVECPCPNATSTGDCDLSGEEVTCSQCLPGHRGALCDTCTAGHRWDGARCQPHRCALCRDADCRDCPLLAAAGRSSSQPSRDGGSVPLLAVLATLGVLLLAVGLGSCYRYWSHQRHRPRLPLWSMELQSPPTSQPQEDAQL